MIIALETRIRPHWTDQKKLTQLKQYLFDQTEPGVGYDASHTKSAIAPIIPARETASPSPRFSLRPRGMLAWLPISRSSL